MSSLSFDLKPLRPPSLSVLTQWFSTQVLFNNIYVWCPVRIFDQGLCPFSSFFLDMDSFKSPYFNTHYTPEYMASCSADEIMHLCSPLKNFLQIISCTVIECHYFYCQSNCIKFNMSNRELMACLTWTELLKLENVWFSENVAYCMGYNYSQGIIHWIFKLFFRSRERDDLYLTAATPAQVLSAQHSSQICQVHLHRGTRGIVINILHRFWQ